MKLMETKLNSYEKENTELKAEVKKLSTWRNKIEANMCSDEWVPYHGHAYKYHSTKMNWVDAQIACEKEGGYQVEIEDRLESDWITNTFLKKDSCKTYDVSCMVWTGGSDIEEEGVYKWSHSNRTFQFTNWNPQQPSIARPEFASFEDCVNLLPAGDWNDAPCGMNFDFLCEKSLYAQLCQTLT
ncbi:C-type mannose receptor 2-like [Saccostrea cucullata]|uniref:C-type mannose receptor 2-like n=1 Tax=Saccostrea cuccullata TaxID=36930 RepID=UPI002ED4E2CE